MVQISMLHILKQLKVDVIRATFEADDEVVDFYRSMPLLIKPILVSYS